MEAVSLVSLIARHLPSTDKEWEYIARELARDGNACGWGGTLRTKKSLQIKFSKFYLGKEGKNNLIKEAQWARIKMKQKARKVKRKEMDRQLKEVMREVVKDGKEKHIADEVEKRSQLTDQLKNRSYW